MHKCLHTEEGHNALTESNGVEMAMSAVFFTSTNGITTSVHTSAAMNAASSSITRSPPVPRNLHAYTPLHAYNRCLSKASLSHSTLVK